MLVRVGPIAGVNRGELRPDTVLNAQLGLFHLATKHHAGRQPIRDLHRKWVGHLARARWPVWERSNLEHKVDDREVAVVVAVDSSFALAVGLAEVDILAAVETHCQIVSWEARPGQVDVHHARYGLTRHEGDHVALQLDKDLPVPENFLLAMCLFVAHRKNI